MGQTIDYLETRPDIDAKKLGFYGLSLGAVEGVRLIALEDRFKAAAFVSGGLWGHPPAEIDPWNYAPRVRTPVLMLNGRDDLIYPVETAQKPMFNALGTQDKRFAVLGALPEGKISPEADRRRPCTGSDAGKRRFLS